jgi:hypothetical protein
MGLSDRDGEVAQRSVRLGAKFVAVSELQQQIVVKIRASDPRETGTKKGRTFESFSRITKRGCFKISRM